MQTTLPKKPTQVKETCYHCGDVCAATPIVFNDKPFCCEGCKAVYTLLQENGLCDYYDLSQSPGINLRQPRPSEAFDYLDEPEIVDRLIDFTDGKTARVTFYVPAIHCSSCLWLLENLPKLMPSITASRVNFVKKEVTITYRAAEVTLRNVVELLASVGYTPLVTLDSDNRQEKKQRPTGRKLVIQLGVAAFCFGNIMLLSFPEYLGFAGEEDQLQGFINLLNFVLALPVVFYSAQDYFLSAWKSLKRAFVNIDVPISIGIVALFLRSTWEVYTATGAGYFDSLAGLLFFLLLGRWFQDKSYDHLSFERKYTSYFPLAVQKWLDGTVKNVPVSEVKRGDILLIRNKELIPADSMLLSKEASIDYSFVTGESEPVGRRQNDLLYAGGRQQGESIRVLVQKDVSESHLTQLWNHSSFKKRKEEEHLQLVDAIAKYFTLVVMLLAFGSLLFWWGRSAAVAINAFTAVLIVACPCALALATPFTLGNAMVVMGKAGLYLKNTNIIERMATISRVVFDKTGTVTRADHGEAVLSGAFSQEELHDLFSLTAHSTHPLSRRLHRYLWQPGMEPARLLRYQELENKGIEGAAGGNVYRIGSPAFCHEEAPENVSAGSAVYIAVNGLARGRFVVQTKLRHGLGDLVHAIERHHATTLLSGDRPADHGLMKGVFSEKAPLLFQQTPEDKLNYVARCQAQGEKVMMLGDGLNDAGALQQADVGMAISEDVASFSPASDAILDARAFEKLPRLLAFARSARNIIFVCFGVSFAYNVVGLSFAMTGMLTPLLAAILMPLSSVTIVGLSTALVKIAAGRLKIH